MKEKMKTQEGEIQKEAVIEDFSAPDSIKRRQELKIVVSGHFSNQGWKLAEATAKIQRKEIILCVIGKKKSGMMSAQALKPYDTTIVVERLKRGKYIIKAQKGTDKEVELIVK